MTAEDAQVGRLRALDPRLAGASMPHMFGSQAVERGDGADRAAVGWTLRRLADDHPMRAWTSAVTALAAPLVLPGSGSVEAERGAAAVLAEWRRAVAAEAPDAVLQVTWPSVDDAARRRLVGAGFEPRGVFALRPAGAPPRVRPEIDRAGTFRRARSDEVDVAFALHDEEMAFHDELGSDDGLAAAAARTTYDRMAASLTGGGTSRIHLVDVAGVAVAMCESWPVEVTERGATSGHSAGGFLPPGRYAYLNSVCVTASHRGRGLGAQLVAGVLRDLRDVAEDGTFLWYESRNPVSPGFWQAMGYLPLWTRYKRQASL